VLDIVRRPEPLCCDVVTLVKQRVEGFQNRSFLCFIRAVPNALSYRLGEGPVT
jgi:hypothetical protein